MRPFKLSLDCGVSLYGEAATLRRKDDVIYLFKPCVSAYAWYEGGATFVISKRNLVVKDGREAFDAFGKGWVKNPVKSFKWKLMDRAWCVGEAEDAAKFDKLRYILRYEVYAEAEYNHLTGKGWYESPTEQYDLTKEQFDALEF